MPWSSFKFKTQFLGEVGTRIRIRVRIQSLVRGRVSIRSAVRVRPTVMFKIRSSLRYSIGVTVCIYKD